VLAVPKTNKKDGACWGVMWRVAAVGFRMESNTEIGCGWQRVVTAGWEVKTRERGGKKGVRDDL